MNWNRMTRARGLRTEGSLSPVSEATKRQTAPQKEPGGTVSFCVRTALRVCPLQGVPSPSRGRLSRGLFGGRKRDRHTNHAMTERIHNRGRLAPAAIECSEFPSRVPVVPLSSYRDGNSQIARRRVDTSLSSRSSRRSGWWYRHVQVKSSSNPTPSLLNYGNYGNSKRNTVAISRFVSSRPVQNSWELWELGGER